MAKGMRSNSKRTLRTQHRQVLEQSAAHKAREAERQAAMQRVLDEAPAKEPFPSAMEVTFAARSEEDDAAESVDGGSKDSAAAQPAATRLKTKYGKRTGAIRKSQKAPMLGNHKKRKMRGHHNPLLLHKH
ncbi:hypothetical protein WJX73_008692 [Symbiochloris irregularis]|uniref:Ribosome biogenesis protein NOP53 n=1 Tax=Symbiochloris irregularis TaxID=706552 RepID=A0AAW1NSY2_9CHLO